MSVRWPSPQPIWPVLVATIFLGCDADSPSAPAGESQRSSAPALDSVAVETALARTEPWETMLATQGSLEVDESSSIGFKVPGRVVELGADVGSILSPTAVLSRLDDVDYVLRVERALSQVKQTRALLGLLLEGEDDRVDVEATTQVRLARAVLADAAARRARAETLRNDGVVDDAEFDAAVSAARVAEERVSEAQQDVANLRAQLLERRAELALARQQLADCTLTAPYEGVVVRRRVGRGDFATAGEAIFDIVRIDPIRLRVAIPEKFGSAIVIGQVVRFTVEGDPKVHSSSVMRLPPALEQSNRTLFLEADVANPQVDGIHRLRAGSFAKVEIVLDSSSRTLVVPTAALRSFAGVDRVVAVVDGKAKEMLVTVGRKEGTRVEILRGLIEGSTVILDPGSLTSGRPVTTKAAER